MVDPPSSSSSPATISFRSSSANPRARTVSTPAQTKASDDISVAHSWTVVAEEHQDKSTTGHGDTPSKERRSISSAASSASHFSVPKTFSISSSLGLFARRRKTTTRRASRTQAHTEDVLADVIEIGPDRESRDENDEEAERERLRDAAAQALGLGFGREEHVEEDGEEDETPVTEHSTQPFIEPTSRIPPLLSNSPAPPSITSLYHPLPSPSIVTTSHMPDCVPSYPCALSALTPYIQTRSSLLRYHPAATFLALSLNRRTKQWRVRHVILTAPLPPPLALAQADLLAVPGQHRPGSYSAPQHAHLHLFKNATPTPDEYEIDRLEINEDSVVFVAEQEVAGRRDVVKVGGRDARGQGAASTSASIKSVARSWHGGVTTSSEQSIEEMGRTMWLLKMADGAETQRWIGYIKTAVLVQRAERAGMTFQPNGSSNGVPSMRADLDVLLSLRSQGLLPSVAVPSRAETPPGLPATTNGTSTNAPPFNPRFAEHVGLAPSHMSHPPSSLRARTYPSSSNALTLPSLKGLFSSAPAPPQSDSRPPSPQSDTHADIDPIAEESGSLGTRATALFNMFRSGSRTSYTNGHSQNNRTSVTPISTAPPAPRVHGIGSPISPVQFVDEPGRAPAPSAQTSFSVDWSTMQGGRNVGPPVSKHTSLSLPPPPRNHRRPWTSGGPGDNPRRQKTLSHGKATTLEPVETASASASQHGPHTPTPPVSPLLSASSPPSGSRRPPSVNSISSYTSAERDRLSDLSRRQSRTVPKMLAPPTGPPPNAPSLRAHSPSFNGPPSPIFEQDYLRRNGSGRLEHQSGSTLGSPSQSQIQNNPYSKRVSSSSARSVNTVSTGHSFLGTKAPLPPPRPPPTFAPPPAPPTDQADASATSRHSSARESFLPRSLRLSLLPPAAPPTHSLPPRPDEPGYRHRRSSSSDAKAPSTLFSIPGSPTPPTFPAPPPPAPPPPNGPLPPTPTAEGGNDGAATRSLRPPSMSRRLRIMSAPAPPHMTIPLSELPARRSLDPPPPSGAHVLPHPEDHPHMFLNMNDTPTTPAMTHSPSFLHVSSPLQPSPDDVEPTSLSPPPRRNSRTSKEIQRVPNLDRDESKHPLSGGSPPLEPRDSAVVLG